MVLMFPEELKNVHMELFNLKKKQLKIRPHWNKIPALNRWNGEAINMANIKYIITDSGSRHDPGNLDTGQWELVAEDSGLKLWENSKWSSALQLFTDWEVISKSEDALKTIRNLEFKFSNTIYLDKTQNEVIDPNKKHKKSNSEVLIIETKPHKQIIKVTTDSDGIIFVPELWDKYWQARIDGQKSTVLRANGAFRAVAVQKGTHLIEFSYHLTTFYVGIAISLITALICGGYMMIKKNEANNFQP